MMKFANNGVTVTMGLFRGPYGGRISLSLNDERKTICVSLRWVEVAQMIQVLRGMDETVGNGKGINVYCGGAGDGRNAVLRFTHVIEPDPGYYIELKDNEGREIKCLLPYADGIAMSFVIALDGVFPYMCFGTEETDATK